jgi:hypothetical protein
MPHYSPIPDFAFMGDLTQDNFIPIPTARRLSIQIKDSIRQIPFTPFFKGGNEMTTLARDGE